MRARIEDGKTNSQRHAERMREIGMTKVTVFVPECDRDLLRRYAAGKRKKFLAGKAK